MTFLLTYYNDKQGQCQTIIYWCNMFCYQKTTISKQLEISLRVLPHFLHPSINCNFAMEKSRAFYVVRTSCGI